MHPLFQQATGLTHDVIGAAIEVHRDKGPGLLESIYEWCLTMELELRQHVVKAQEHVSIRYKQFQREEPLRFDLLVDKCLFVEVKAIETVHPVLAGKQQVGLPDRPPHVDRRRVAQHQDVPKRDL